jgi:hypothetical protein
MTRNMGEQLMFHFGYDGGGLFHVTDAGTESGSVDPADAKYAGPRPTPSIYTHDLRSIRSTRAMASSSGTTRWRTSSPRTNCAT